MKLISIRLVLLINDRKTNVWRKNITNMIKKPEDDCLY
jgi:hypothetical protein